jgi:Flp pilus assembly protein TadD
VALEQDQRAEEAQAAFEKAVALAPTNPAVLSNFAMFLAGQGEKDRAEALLRKAVALPGAGPAERQNLALLLGLSGRLDEAERLERQDLPPEVVTNDLAWLKGADDSRSWTSLAKAP